jgi:hypothetical protein
MQEVQGWSMFLTLRKLKQWIDSRKHWMQDKEQVGIVGRKSGFCNKEKDSDCAFLAGQALNQNHATQFFSNKRVRFPTPCGPSC